MRGLPWQQRTVRLLLRRNVRFDDECNPQERQEIQPKSKNYMLPSRYRSIGAMIYILIFVFNQDCFFRKPLSKEETLVKGALLILTGL
ncbi:hypothetical protein PROAA_1060024 [Candidatus Propionivibrio aalborgensis]|uniref:Uncharacterized protein n=1 Tax=Candidatus Propionivibrio aalborgensis TaxID=1860101 RepID=A0A1A8XE36_9RHOO|nr:hypothetical protein PROAA_1060024 [Candidatus Propionivibrio aalborgensis]